MFDFDEELQAQTKEEKDFSLILHLSPLAGLVFPFGHLVAPFVIWMLKKKESLVLNEVGKEVLNAAISASLYGLVASALFFALIGFLLLPALIVAYAVCIITGSVRASEGRFYRYPFIFRLLK